MDVLEAVTVGDKITVSICVLISFIVVALWARSYSVTGSDKKKLKQRRCSTPGCEAPVRRRSRYCVDCRLSDGSYLEGK